MRIFYTISRVHFSMFYLFPERVSCLTTFLQEQLWQVTYPYQKKEYFCSFFNDFMGKALLNWNHKLYGIFPYNVFLRQDLR